MNVQRLPLDAEEHEALNQLVTMTTHTLEAIDQLSELIGSGDMELAQRIMASDAVINQAFHATEEICIVSIARQQPVASDLRLLMCASHIAAELERIADHVAGAARTLMNIGGETLGANREALLNMTGHARAMVDKSIEACLHKDVASAESLAADDDRLDALQNEITAHLMASFNHASAEPEEISRLLWVVHDLERIGDRAVNIGERVIYMVDGRVIELNH